MDAIIRGGLTRFTDQLGKLWCSLADYYIRSGHFEKVCGEMDVSCHQQTGYGPRTPGGVQVLFVVDFFSVK